MSSEKKEKNRFQLGLEKTGQGIKTFVHQTRDLIRTGRVNLHNWRRRRALIEYVMLPLSGSYPERDAPEPGFLQRRLPLPLPPQPVSIQSHHSTIQALIDADNVNGVVFYIENLSVSLARLQTLRQSIRQLKAAGKKTVAYLKYPTLGTYFLACEADQIIVPPSSSFGLVVGLYREILFYRDSLEQIGVEFENLQISPYKSALDTLSKDGMSPEFEAQINWLLDEQFDMLTRGIAEGRDIPHERVLELIDQAPLELNEALQHQLIDQLLYEDELVDFFFPPDEEKKEEKTRIRRQKLVRVEQAARFLKRKYHPIYREKAIGVVSLVGSIVQGESQQSPIPLPIFGSNSAGEKSLLRLLRQVEKMGDLGALIFYVDTPGGDAFASDLIQREIERIGKKLPVVVYMGDVAASGGYYVSAKAKYIISQPATVTGSIGVVSGKASLSGLYEKAHIKSATVQRGKHAGLYAGTEPLTEEERSILFNSINETYKEFKWVVATGRNLPFEELDPICLGKVWTGRQALGHKLVDANGSFLDAIVKARELADMPTDLDVHVPILNLYDDRKQNILPESFNQPAESLAQLLQYRLKLGSGPQLIMPFKIVDHY